MAKQPSLKYVKFTRAKGKLYAYFNTGRKVGGKPVYATLPPFGSVGFYDSYASFLGARTKREMIAPTVRALCEAYEASDDFNKRLSDGTRQTYRSTMRRIIEQLGDFPVEDVERRHVREILDNRMEGNGARNIFLSVLGLIYGWARGRDMTERRPTEGIKPYDIGEHDPWPDELLQAGLTAENDRVRLAVNILFYSGLRIGDAVALRWSDIRNGKIIVTPQKTKRLSKTLQIPMTRDLEAELARTPKRGITIMVNNLGQPLKSADVIRKALKSFAADHGFDDAVPHGLRKNAVNSLLLAGCTIAEVASITGQTFKVVEHYASKIDQIALGEAAIFKLERKADTQTLLKTASQPRTKASSQ